MKGSGQPKGKRKVQFGKDEVREFKKAKHEEEEDDAEMATVDDAKTGEGSRLNGYSIDSDEEDEEELAAAKSRYELTDEDKHEVLDTEFTDGGVKVTGFNLDEEMEDGYFDDSGNYHENKNDDHTGDEWLKSAATYVPKEQTNAFKPNFSEDSETISKDERPKLLKQMLSLMKTGESTQRALRRLGGQGGSSERKWQSQKNAKKKNAETTEKKSEVDIEGFNTLTSCTDKLASVGEYDVYQYTYEKIVWELKKVEAELQAAKEKAEAAERENAAANDPDATYFEFKWTEDESAEVYGPYSAHQMLGWQDSGYFKKGVFCRELKKGTEQKFYNSSRIDFDLYT